MKLHSIALTVTMCLFLAACASSGPVRYITATPDDASQAATRTPSPSLPASSPTPTLKAATATPVPATSSRNASATCSDLDAAWGDWPAAIDVLQRLINSGQSCGPELLESKLYAAHFNYAVSLEGDSDAGKAVTEYLAAFALDPRREDALKALVRLNALPTATPSPCAPLDPDSAPPPASTADESALVRVDGQHLVLDGQPFRIRGVNYYPRHTPWDRFLAQADPLQMKTEINLIAGTGFNAIRIFLWYQPLFDCRNGQTVPDEATFGTLDTLLGLAAARGLKVLVTLNDLPDLYITPLYTADSTSDALTAYIVRRYRDNPAIFAWDVRNEADLDYRPGRDGIVRFARGDVLEWLGRTSRVIRANDPNHLITAGWWGNPTETSPDVDFLSFHHWEAPELLAGRIDAYQAANDKPILLEETGYSSWATGAQSGYEPQGQADALKQMVQTAEEKGLAGWMIWTAFDFEPAPGQVETYEHHFGLWTLDLAAKPALQALPLP